MKKVLLFLVCAGITVLASADVKIVQSVKSGSIMGQPPTDTTVTMSVKGKKARIETAKESNYQIIDLEAGKVFIVEPQRKQVRVITTEMMKQMSGMMGQLAGNQGKPVVEKLGTTHTYAGHKCEDVKVTTSGMMNMTAVSCIAEDLAIAEFEPFKAFGQDFTRVFGLDLAQETKGFAVHTESTINMMGQKIDSTSELVIISRDPLAESLFVVPADYKIEEMKMPTKEVD